MTQGSGPTILGIPTEAVTLVPTSAAADTGLTREIVCISAFTALPVRILGYDGDVLVRQVDFADLKFER